MSQEVQVSACESHEDQSDPRAETIPEIYPLNEAGETAPSTGMTAFRGIPLRFRTFGW